MILEKVTVFITRGPVDARELLVFTHPRGGVQLPAGTVEEGEPAETAALREAWEETGLSALSIVALLGSEEQNLPDGQRVVLRRVRLRETPDASAPFLETPDWFLGLRRGLYVRSTEEANGYAHVVYEEYDRPMHECDAPARSLSGWVEADSVTPTVVRHFYHLIPTEPTGDSWVQIAEEWEHRFELYWVPLPPADRATETGLVPYHVSMLADYAEKMRA